MPESSLLKKIVLILFGIVIVLLVLNIILTKFSEKNVQPKGREEISGIEIDSLFKSALSNYGFSNSWITKKSLRKISGDSLYSTYSVSVPKEVPIHLILLELKNIFWEHELEIEAEELTKKQKTLVKLTSGKQLKLAAELFYSENSKREFGTISFLVKDLPLENEELLMRVYKYTRTFLFCSDSK